MIDLNEIVSGIVLSKSFTVSQDEDTKDEGITLHATLKFEGVSLRSVFDAAVAPKVIQKQGYIRKHWSEFKDGQHIVIEFKAPAKSSVDPLDHAIAMAAAAGLSIEEWLKAELAKRAGK